MEADGALRVAWTTAGNGYDMEQLSWTDDMMLRAEKPETPMQIQMLLIYDQSTAPDGKVISSTTCVTSHCLSRGTGVSCAYRSHASMDASSTFAGHRGR